MKNQTTLTALRETVRRWWNETRDSEFMRGAASLTLFPQHPEVDSSFRAQNEEIAKVWREVHGYIRSAYYQETGRIDQEYERKK